MPVLWKVPQVMVFRRHNSMAAVRAKLPYLRVANHEGAERFCNHHRAKTSLGYVGSAR